MNILHELHRQGATIVMVTHEPERAAHAERVITVRDGEIVNEARKAKAQPQGSQPQGSQPQGLVQHAE